MAEFNKEFKKPETPKATGDNYNTWILIGIVIFFVAAYFHLGPFK